MVVEARGLPARGEITWEHVAPVADQLVPGVVVLLRTGWSAHYGTPSYFEHPFLGAGACERMLDLGVRTFCIDAINIDETPTKSTREWASRIRWSSSCASNVAPTRSDRSRSAYRRVWCSAVAAAMWRSTVESGGAPG